MVRGPGIQGRCSSRRGWHFSRQTASTRSTTTVGGDNAKVAIALGAIPLPSVGRTLLVACPSTGRLLTLSNPH
uniref:Uncharacterized protein n=1 Tax=Vespula pensylvanica TaxID=30213 RepID=A0A834P1P4_VESPE|nr:hypothetical protein H0235_007648 [Vespula pensylvanica]